jgi:hypothetical protein
MLAEEQTLRLTLDLGDDDHLDWLDVHLAGRGLSVGDILMAAQWIIPRRKGDRMYGYGRGMNGQPIVVVLSQTVSG